LITARRPAVGRGASAAGHAGGAVPDWEFWAVAGGRTTTIGCCSRGIGRSFDAQAAAALAVDDAVGAGRFRLVS
jgi:hypothetical protein